MDTGGGMTQAHDRCVNCGASSPRFDDLWCDEFCKNTDHAYWEIAWITEHHEVQDLTQLPNVPDVLDECRCERCDPNYVREVQEIYGSLPVQEARSVAIIDVAERLDLGPIVPSGTDYVALCPFHSDHEPSLRLSPHKNAWYCFPCNDGGDGIDLWMQVRKVDFSEAVQEMVE